MRGIFRRGMCVTAIHVHAWITVIKTHELRDKGATVLFEKST